MSTAALLSIKPVYANRILAGQKTIELRKSNMGLCAGDAILVYSSAPEQQIAFWFTIEKIDSLAVGDMWERHSEVLGIDHGEYERYFGEVNHAVGLHIGDIHRVTPIPLRRIEELVPGFVPPQGLVWLRNEAGRFKELLASLSTPLPDEVFLQRSLSFSA